MKRLTGLFILASLTVNVLAQNQVTLRQQNFPVAMPMEDENIEWQRDIYREINLMADENAGLYCPIEPSKNQKGLFTKIFNLAITKAIPIYRYNIDGNEVFNEANKADIRDILTNHHIFYQEEDGNNIVDNSDIPAQQVMMYYIKEGMYYDMTNSTFRIKVLALCPVMVDEEEYNGETRYPLFWVLYKDLEPYIKSLPVIPNYGNKAMVMPMTDYFTLNKYKGDIYKVSNTFGKTLRQMCDSDSAYVAAQQRIERELKRVVKTTYNTYYGNPKDSVSQKRLWNREAQRPRKKLFRWPWQKKDNK